MKGSLEQKLRSYGQKCPSLSVSQKLCESGALMWWELYSCAWKSGAFPFFPKSGENALHLQHRTWQKTLVSKGQRRLASNLGLREPRGAPSYVAMRRLARPLLWRTGTGTSSYSLLFSLIHSYSLLFLLFIYLLFRLFFSYSTIFLSLTYSCFRNLLFFHSFLFSCFFLGS